jgi:hypothetical protein
VADVSLMAVPSQQDGTKCPNCGAEVVADQRYCLSCGHPVAPVRLGFLDALHDEGAHPAPQWSSAETLQTSTLSYPPPPPESGLGGWIRRNSALFALLSVLILCLIVGLLVGHWVSQNNKSSGPQEVKVQFPAGLAAASGASSSPTTTTAKPAAPKAAKAKEAQEAAQGAKETKAEKAPPPPAVKVSTQKIQKLNSTHGKKHAEEVNSLGATPIETPNP